MATEIGTAYVGTWHFILSPAVAEHFRRWTTGQQLLAEGAKLGLPSADVHHVAGTAPTLAAGRAALAALCADPCPWCGIWHRDIPDSYTDQGWCDSSRALRAVDGAAACFRFWAAGWQRLRGQGPMAAEEFARRARDLGPTPAAPLELSWALRPLPAHPYAPHPAFCPQEHTDE